MSMVVEYICDMCNLGRSEPWSCRIEIDTVVGKSRQVSRKRVDLCPKCEARVTKFIFARDSMGATA